MNNPLIDIKEDDIFAMSPELLDILLKDHTLSKNGCQVNIFWATDNYAHRGPGYQYSDQITIHAITGANGNVIVPRAVKSREQQQQRSRKMAEVFTPSWICNKQNNLVDNAWFGRDNVFNTEIDDKTLIEASGLPGDGAHSWIVNPDPITFPDGKTWRDYVAENRLEITCGEAPYLVSRYDTVTGEPIPVERRIGMLDRKLRIVSENTTTADEWLDAAQSAFKGTYGFEWQGDNLVLAREALLYTFIDYYRAKFGTEPSLDSLLNIAYIISWNIWQMDGLKGVVPNSCKKVPRQTDFTPSMFGGEDTGEQEDVPMLECPGCKKKDVYKHTGTYCEIMDWEINEPVRFVSLYRKN